MSISLLMWQFYKYEFLRNCSGQPRVSLCDNCFHNPNNHWCYDTFITLNHNDNDLKNYKHYHHDYHCICCRHHRTNCKRYYSHASGFIYSSILSPTRMMIPHLLTSVPFSFSFFFKLMYPFTRLTDRNCWHNHRFGWNWKYWNSIFIFWWNRYVSIIFRWVECWQFWIYFVVGDWLIKKLNFFLR